MKIKKKRVLINSTTDEEEIQTQYDNTICEDSFWEGYRKQHNLDIDYEDEFGDCIKLNRFYEVPNYSFFNDLVEIKFSSSVLPKKNEKLSTMFPEIKKYRNKKEHFINVYTNGYVPRNEIASMFLEVAK